MTLQTQPFEISDFSGGITDNYLDGDRKQFKDMDNVIIQLNRKVYTRPGSVIYDATNYITPAGNNRIGGLVNFNEELITNVGRNIHYIDGTFQTLNGVGGNPVLSAGDVNSLLHQTQWKDHLVVSNNAISKPAKIFRDSGNTITAFTAGLPNVASDPTITNIAGSNSYIYAFVHFVEYTVGDLTFQDFGARRLVSKENIEAPDVNTVNITAIPVLANAADENYDTANIKIVIYRTINGGTDFYEVGRVDNGVTNFNDSTSDTDLVLNTPAYTNTGALDNDPPPECKFVHVTNNTAFYAHVKEGTNTNKYRVRQSVQNDIDSAPASFVIDVEDEITGISSFRHIPVVFCKNSAYRIDGLYNEDGSGFAQHQKITDESGCVSHNSIVRTDYGTFFAGNDGFYWTDGYKVIKVSNSFNTTYKAFVANNPEKITGTYDLETNRVWWAVQENAASTDNDKIYVLDLNFGISPESTFTTISGCFKPSSLAFLGKQVVRGDEQGYIFKHTEVDYTDPIIDTGTTPDNWEEATIIYDICTSAFDFGTTYARKMVTRAVVNAEDETKLALQVQSINDDGRKTANLFPICFESAITWGEADVVWGDNALIWNFQGIIDEQRRFPSQNLRCSYKQCRLTNAYVEIDSSDKIGNVIVDNTLKTATLVGAATSDFIAEPVNYFISFESDNFERQYKITNRTNDTVTFEDTSNNAPSGEQQWKIKGYPKGQILNLLNLTLHYAIIGKTQKHL